MAIALGGPQFLSVERICKVIARAGLAGDDLSLLSSFLRQGFAMLPKLVSNLVSQVARTTGTHHHAQLPLWT